MGQNLCVLLMLVAVNCKVIDLEDNVLTGESMVEVVQRLVKEVNALKTDNQKLKVNDQKLKEETEKLKVNDQKLKEETDKLKADNQKLKADSERLKADNKELKAEVSRLKNNGHTRFSVADQQTECDASLSIMGAMGRVKSVNRAAGSFY